MAGARTGNVVFGGLPSSSFVSFSLFLSQGFFYGACQDYPPRQRPYRRRFR